MRWFWVGLAWVWAQSYEYGNSWYNPTQSYRKLLVGESGVYRVRASDVGLSGVPVSSLQLLWRGREVPLYVADLDGSGTFEGNDYLEFVGLRNDGEPDSVAFRHPQLLRRLPGLQGNKYMSLNQNDTSAYFLTWGGGPGRRYATYEDGQALSRPSLSWFWYQMVESFHNAGYWPGPGGYGIGGYEQFSNPMYISGEGRGASFNPYARGYSLPGALPSASPFYKIEVSHASLNFSGTFTLNWQVELGSNTYAAASQTLNAPYFQRMQLVVPTTYLGSYIIVHCQSPTTGYSGELVHYAEITYPRAGNSLGAAEVFLSLGVVNSDPTPRVLAVSGLSVSGGDSVLVYDTVHQLRMRAYRDGSQWLIPLPGLADTFALFLVRGESIRTPLVTTPRLENYSGQAGAEIILVTSPSLQASAEAYKAYRETHPTNPRSVLIAYTDAIDDEFGWGRVRHPLAIRNLVRWALDHWTTKPKYLLLWGDVVSPAALRMAYNGAPPAWHKVPGYGILGTVGELPSSDWGFVSDFYGDGTVIPAIPVGRVPVQNDQQGYAYIDKLRTYESQGLAPWRKWALHLGGGSSAVEQALIRAQLVACQNVLEGSPYAGSTVYYQKQTGGMQAPPGTPTIKERMDSGVVILQTFGHTGGDLFDVAFYEPQDYENWGRYPFVIVNGCYQGDVSGIINGSQSHGERFVMAPGRGSLWYWALAGAGFIGPLGNQTRRIYEVLFRDSLGISVGDAIVEAFRRLFSQGVGSFEYYHMAASLLLGDPSVPLIVPKLPDLAISRADLVVVPAEPSAEQSSFELRIRYHNLGLAVQDSFTVQVVHQVQSTGQVYTYTYRRPPFLRTDSLSVLLPAPAGEWAGTNFITVTLDALLEVQEEREDNNTVTLDFFVKSARPILIYPWPFAVINKDSIALIAGTYNQSGYQTQGYYFEIDTSYLFNSPMLRQSGLVQGSTVFGQWVVPYRLQDSVVYYWRVRLANAAPNEWAEASFQYIAGDKEGWGQSGRAQFLSNTHQGLSYGAPGFTWQFQSRQVRLEVRDTWGPTGNRRFLILNDRVLSSEISHTLTRYVNPSNPAQGYYTLGWWWGAFIPGVFIAAFDGNTYEPLIADTLFGGWRLFCPRYCAHAIGSMSPAQMADSLWQTIDRLPNGSIVVLLFTQFFKASQEFVRPTMDNVLGAIGASSAILSLDSLQKAIVVGRKGAPASSAIEVITADTLTAEVIQDYTTTYPIGWMSSPLIPRPVDWEDFFFAFDSLNGRGKILSTVYARKPDNSEVVVHRRVSSDGVYDLRGLNTTDYTSLRLEGYFMDTLMAIAPSMRYWYVLFRPFPDVAVDPGLRWVLLRDTVQEGETLYVALGLRNLLSAPTPDSIWVQLSIQKADGSWLDVGRVRVRPLAGLDTTIVAFSFSSIGLGGLNRLRIVANPDPSFGERTFANNRWEAAFFVQADIYNPVVDVLFDGVRIQNGDIVSPSPVILVEAKDENPFLALDDTASMTIRLRRVEERSLGERISYASGKLRFEGARLPDNRARVEFRPGRLEDGDYVLAVEAQDKRYNRSGTKPYEIQFRIINESAITHVVNYPNPFSTSTRFYYELTGSSLPEVFQIHIYTVTGRLVKVIDLKALGEVRIGRHLTQYAWDGTDEYGDRLANGVYLYRVVLRMPGEAAIQRREDGLEGYFKSGWGKMVLMR